MVSEIAHQLNNPLVGVVNMAQLAERKIDDPTRIKELLDEIGRAGKDCHAFVKRMLEFTKISSFDRKPTDMNMLIEETVSLFHHSVSPRQKIVCELAEVSPILDVDPVLIRHALFNLLSNAAQVSPAGGKITISLSKVYPDSLKKRKGLAKFVWKDSCCRHDSRRIFNHDGTGRANRVGSEWLGRASSGAPRQRTCTAGSRHELRGGQFGISA